MAEAWVTGPSLESCELPELSTKEGSRGPLMTKKGDWKLVRQVLSAISQHGPHCHGELPVVWCKDSWRRDRHQPIMNNMQGISIGWDRGLCRRIWLAWSRMLGEGSGTQAIRRLVLDEDLKTGTLWCRNEEDEGIMR